jgi:hypothetical protein
MQTDDHHAQHGSEDGTESPVALPHTAVRQLSVVLCRVEVAAPPRKTNEFSFKLRKFKPAESQVQSSNLSSSDPKFGLGGDDKSHNTRAQKTPVGLVCLCHGKHRHPAQPTDVESHSPGRTEVSDQARDGL